MSHYSDKSFTDGIRRRPQIAERGRVEKSAEIYEGKDGSEDVRDVEPRHDGILITESQETTLSPELEDLKDLYSAPRPARKFLAGGLVAGFLAIFIGAMLLTFFFSRLTVEIKPRVESVSFGDLLIALDTSVSRTLLQQKVVPAELLEFSRKAKSDFESSGKEFIEDRARGRVKVYNRFSSAPQALVSGTRFISDSGVLFRLSKNIVIPGAKIADGKIVPEFIEVELTADKAGEGSNMSGAVNLSIPGFRGTAKYDGFYAQALSGFSGGFSGEARIITKDDIKMAEEKVSKRAFDDLKEETSRKVPPGFKLVEAMREVQIVKVSSPRERTRGDNFSVEVEARARMFVFREEDIRGLLQEIVVGDKNDAEVLGDSLDLQYQVRTADYAKGKAQALVRGSVKTKARISQSEIAQAVKGRKEGSIIEALKGRHELASFSVSFFPPWIFSAPEDADRIRVIGGD